MEPKSSQMSNDGSCSVPNSNTTTEEIQKLLEENKQLILFIMGRNRVGKQKECEMHVAKLQENLTTLTNLADAMSRPHPGLPPQIPAPPTMGHQGHWMQQPEAAAAMSHQQVPSFARQPPQTQLNDSTQQQHQKQQPSYLQRQHFTDAQMGFDPSANADLQLAMQFGAQSGSSHDNMFDAMGTNQDGTIGSGGGNFLGM